MKKTNKNAIKLLRKAAGERLSHRRRELGYKSSHAAWTKLCESGIKISYFRYQKLEAGHLPKNELELFGVSRFLDIGLDCWLEGLCKREDEAAFEELKQLPEAWQTFFKRTIQSMNQNAKDLDLLS